jgi:hypothetical protein
LSGGGEEIDVEYSIEWAESLHELEMLVCKGIDKGWMPQGGIGCSNDGAFFQALIRNDSETKTSPTRPLEMSMCPYCGGHAFYLKIEEDYVPCWFCRACGGRWMGITG